MIKKLIFFFFAFTFSGAGAWATLSPNLVWQVQTGGSETNGGAFFGDINGASGVSLTVAVIQPPSAPTITCTSSTGGTIAQGTYFGVITFSDSFGETVVSAQGTVVVNTANCGGNTATNRVTFTAPVSAPGCQSGAPCTWSGYLGSTTGGPWAQSFNAQTLGVNAVVTSIPALPGTQASGTDYSQSDTAHNPVTNAVANGTTTITSATAGFDGSWPGNVCYVSGGTGSITAGWYQIKTVTNATTMTVDRSTGLTAGTGVTLNCGGALASPGQALASNVADNKVFIKNDGGGIYWISSASSNVAGGTIILKNSSAGQAPMIVVGYTSSRTLFNNDSRPTLKVCQNAVAPCVGAVNSVIIADTTGNAGEWYNNLILDVNSSTGSTGLHITGTGDWARNIKVLNSTSDGILMSTGANLFCYFCEVTGFSGSAGFEIDTTSSCFACYAHAGTVVGFNLNGNGAFCNFCISAGNTGATTDGFDVACSNGVGVQNSVAYGNGRYGYSVTSGTCGGTLIYINDIAEENANVGFFNGSSTYTSLIFLNNAGRHNNSTTALSGQYTTSLILYPQGFINNTTASFFTNAAAGDFSLNSTTGAGALARGAGFPGVYPAGTTTSYNDIGAAIRQGGVTAAAPASFAGVQ